MSAEGARENVTRLEEHPIIMKQGPRPKACKQIAQGQVRKAHRNPGFNRIKYHER